MWDLCSSLVKPDFLTDFRGLQLDFGWDNNNWFPLPAAEGPIFEWVCRK